MSHASEITPPLLDDLQFVRRAAERATFERPDFIVACVWAFVNLVGFAIYDISILAGGLFWLAALPLFGIGTGWWAARELKKAGEINRELGRRHAWHWTAIPVFLLLSNALLISAPSHGNFVGQVVLLIVGLVYYLGGVHFWRGFWYGGLAISSGVVWLAIFEHYAWTLTGVLTFVALVVPAIVDWKRHAPLG